MLQSHIILTQTYLDIDYIHSFVAFHFFKSLDEGIAFNLFDRENKDKDQLFQVYTKLKNQNKILELSADTKKDLNTQILDIYQKYSEPSLLFLGDLNKYSTLALVSILK